MEWIPSIKNGLQVSEQTLKLRASGVFPRALPAL